MTQLSQPASTYAPELLSHQTGLSVTASSADTNYNIGSAISIPRNGIARINVVGHVSGGTGFIGLTLTRGTSTYPAGCYGASILGTVNSSIISNTSTAFLDADSTSNFSIEIPVLANDSIQLVVAENTANDTIYIDDLVVILQ